MDFPAYVPVGARAHISWTLEGNGKQWRGVNALVAEYREIHTSTDALISLEQEQACVLRFARDIRMGNVYAQLREVFTADAQYADFLRSAWQADMDYGRFRDRVKMARSLAPEIAEAARKLAKLLAQAGEVGGGNAPTEFYSIRSLLDATDNLRLDGHDLYMWRAVRARITGQRPEVSTGAHQLQSMEPMKIVLVPAKPGEVKIDPEEQARNMLFYAWEKAPDLVAIMGTVEAAANNWIPQEGGAIGAAIASRKHNKAAEYLRAFAEHLMESLHLELAGPIVAAMAGTANVVLNDPGADISTDAARAVIKRGVNDSA